MSITPELRAELLAQAQGSQRLNLAYVGVTTGLFAALSDGPLTLERLAAAAAVDPGYATRWADAAAAYGLLDRPGEGFGLTAAGRAFLPDTPDSLMPLALMSVLTAHMAERAAAFAPSGHRPGEGVLGEVETLRPWFGRMLEASFGPLFERAILPALPVFDELGARGGLVVDLGCGNGWYLRRLLARHPRLLGLGMDQGAESLADARARAAAAGLTGRLAFCEGDLMDLTLQQPATMVVMNRALHHVWADGPERVAAALRGHLAPGGAAVIWEPRWPDDPATLGDHPRTRGMSFMHLTEHLQGNHLLRPQEVRAALEGAGLSVTVHLFVDDTEMVLVAREAG